MNWALAMSDSSLPNIKPLGGKKKKTGGLMRETKHPLHKITARVSCSILISKQKNLAISSNSVHVK